MDVAPTSSRCAVVLADGDALPNALDLDLAAALDRASLSVAADGGLTHAHRVDRDPHVLVGDLDSVSREGLARATATGTEVLHHPVDKDATDLELALDLVLERMPPSDGPVKVLVVGGHGGRTDHLFANLLLLSADRYAGLRLTAWWGTDVLHIVRDTVTLTGRIDATVSLLALHGPALGVTTSGLHFPLTDAVLDAGSSRGVSNRLVAPVATVSVTGGVLAVLQSAPD